MKVCRCFDNKLEFPLFLKRSEGCGFEFIFEFICGNLLKCVGKQMRGRVRKSSKEEGPKAGRTKRKKSN